MSLGCYFGNQGFFNTTGYNKSKDLALSKKQKSESIKINLYSHSSNFSFILLSNQPW